MCVRGCVGCGDMVYRCEGGQDENSDYTCINHIHVCVIVLILQLISITNIILFNNAYDINIACLLLRPLKF